MVGNGHTLVKLAEQVRLYSAALINYHGFTPYKYPTKAKTTESVKVKLPKKRYARPGIKSKSKRRKKAKKKKGFVLSKELRESLYSSSKTTSAGELAQLAEQAEEAIELAGQLIGEPAVYVRGMLVGASTVPKGSVFREIAVYKIINGW